MSTSSSTPFLTLRPRGAAGPAPLSFAQELLWLMDRASPGLTAWNVPRALRLRGPLDRAALSRALDALVARHEALRTVFAGGEGDARQIVVPDARVALPVIELTGTDEPARASALTQHIREFARTPFDLTRDVLLRAALIHCADDDHVLCLNTHHIVFDGWSRGIMFRELSALYEAEVRGTLASLPELPIQFADYASWERDPAHERELAPALGYWRQQLAGPLPTLDFPTDFPRPTVQGFAGARRVAVLPRDLVDAIGRVAREHGVTSYMVLLAAYGTLLHRHTGQDEIVVGSPIAGRSQAETEELIGYFANTLVLRERLDGNPSFAELLARVRDTAVDAFDYQDVPFEKLVLELQKGQHLTHAPLFQAVLTMEDTMPAELAFAGIEVEPIGIEDGSTKFDLTLLVGNQADGLRLSLWYRTDLFLPETADRLLGQMRTILEAVVADPSRRIDDIDIVAAEERARLLAAGTGTLLPLGDRPAHVAFADVARRNPDRVALRSGGVALTLGELALRASRMASRLVAAGVRRGDAVALVADRSAESIVGVLGILEAGAAYVPIAPDAPGQRVAQQLADAGVRVAVAATRDQLPQSLVVIDVADDPTVPALGHRIEVGLDDPAYVLFTSGSTGVPKGVVVTHRNAMYYARAIIDRLGVPADGSWTFATISSLTADLGNTAILPAFVTGSPLEVIPGDVAVDAVRFAESMRAHPVDVLKITPNHFRALTATLTTAELAHVLPRQWLVFGGEALRWDLAERVLAAGTCRVLNHYGPTEATVGACAFEVTRESIESTRAAGSRTVPIGTPLANTRCYVLDGAGTLAPSGAFGELYIGGAGVASGYVGRPELTAERFVDDPFGGEGTRMYRTGDRVRWLRTGAIEFVGRVDDQVKVRGYRVELTEIERVLAEHPGIAQSTVLLASSSDAGDDAQLVGYIVLRASGYAAAHVERVDGEAARAWLAERLPDYMVPSVVMVLDALPLTANGKVDRRALPAPAAREAIGEAPGTPTEIAIARIWTDVLKKERVGATDNFLALGGHSLLAIRVLGRLSKQFSVRLPLRTLFEAPTVRELAAVVDEEIRAAEAAKLDAMLAAVEGMSDADVKRMMSPDAVD